MLIYRYVSFAFDTASYSHTGQARYSSARCHSFTPSLTSCPSLHCGVRDGLSLSVIHSFAIAPCLMAMYRAPSAPLLDIRIIYVSSISPFSSSSAARIYRLSVSFHISGITYFMHFHDMLISCVSQCHALFSFHHVQAPTCHACSKQQTMHFLSHTI